MQNFIFLMTFLMLSAPAMATPSCPPAHEQIRGMDVTRECNANTGMVTKEEWRKDGKLNRADGPARATVKYTADQAVVNLQYWKDGKQLADAGPSVRVFDLDKGIVVEDRWLNSKGKLSREAQPAVIHYDPKDGHVTAQEYWINGRKQKAPQQ